MPRLRNLAGAGLLLAVSPRPLPAKEVSEDEFRVVRIVVSPKTLNLESQSVAKGRETPAVYAGD